MTSLKNLLAGASALGIFAMGTWAQERLQSTAPEPATAPSQAATAPQPSTAPSTQVGPAATITYTFEMLDRNGDGAITPDEAARVPALAKAFESLDRNHDGKLDRSEFVGFSQ